MANDRKSESAVFHNRTMIRRLGFISLLFLVTALSSMFYLIVNELHRPFFLDLIIGHPINFAVHRHIAFAFRNPFANPP